MSYGDSMKPGAAWLKAQVDSFKSSAKSASKIVSVAESAAEFAAADIKEAVVDVAEKVVPSES
jgi:hypothetical protein